MKSGGGLEEVWGWSGGLAPNHAVHGGGAPAAFDPGPAGPMRSVSLQGFDTSFRDKGHEGASSNSNMSAILYLGCPPRGKQKN